MEPQIRFQKILYDADCAYIAKEKPPNSGYILIQKYFKRLENIKVSTLVGQ